MNDSQLENSIIQRKSEIDPIQETIVAKKHNKNLQDVNIAKNQELPRKSEIYEINIGPVMKGLGAQLHGFRPSEDQIILL